MKTRSRFGTILTTLTIVAFAASVVSPLAARADSKGMKLLEEIDQAVSDVVQSVLPTVVNISSSKTQEADNPLAGSPLEEFFHFYNRRGNEPRSFKSYSLGSGIIVDGKKGYILTNNHVVEGAEEIYVDFFASDGSIERFEGKAFNDPKTELALVKIKDMKGKTLPQARLGDSDTLKVGHMVLAIGSPFQKSQSVSRGSSALWVGRKADHSSSESFIKTSSRPTPRSTRAIAAAPCLTFMAKSSGSTPTSIPPAAALKASDSQFP
jgi:serine protease Do